MKNTPAIDGLWAGTDASLHNYLQIEASMLECIKAGWGDKPDDDDEDESPRLLSVDNGVGIISIAGPLTNRESPWNDLMGVTSYGEIRDAVLAAASNPEVKHILLDINSGGGAANGVSDVGNLIRLVNDKVKPVTAFTDGAMMSAAYWLGCSAGNVYSTKMSSVGSIGVISTHMEFSKQLKDEGVGVTVMRSGRYKALVNSVEPLTDAAKQQWQSQLDAAYGVFVDHVAQMRGHSSAYIDERMAQGREFFGEAALTAGLVDGITTFDALMSKIREKSVDNSTTFNHNPRNLTGVNNMNKNALTEQDIAALAEGAAAQAAAATAEGAQASAKTQEIADATTNDAQAAAATGDIGAGTSNVSAAAEVAAEAAPAAQAAQTDLTTFLQTQIAEKDKALLDSNVMIKTLEAKLAEQSASFAGLVDIATKSLNNMRVALGMSSVDTSAMSATAVLAEHKSLTTQFTASFKVGGVAAVSAAAEENTADAGMSPLRAARMAAARVST